MAQAAGNVRGQRLAAAHNNPNFLKDSIIVRHWEWEQPCEVLDTCCPPSLVLTLETRRPTMWTCLCSWAWGTGNGSASTPSVESTSHSHNLYAKRSPWDGGCLVSKTDETSQFVPGWDFHQVASVLGESGIKPSLRPPSSVGLWEAHFPGRTI